MSYTVIDIETTGSDPQNGDRLVSVGLGNAERQRVYTPDEGYAHARRVMLTPGATLVAHTNYDLRWLCLNGAALAEGVVYHDTKVMAWLLDANQPLDLAALSRRYLDHDPPKHIRMVRGEVCFNKATGETVPIEQAPWAEVEAYNRSDVETEARLYEELRALLKGRGLWEHFLNEEAPFSRLLIEMEAEGMPFDKDRANLMAAHTYNRLEALREGLVERTGFPDFNPGSGDQVAQYLYEETYEVSAKFPIPRLAGKTAGEKQEIIQSIKPQDVTVTKIGRDYAYGTLVLDGRALKEPPIDKHKPYGSRPTVNSKTLAVMHGDDPWVTDYLEWRRLDKLRGYLVDWIERVHDGRLHPRFDQSGTVTGRLTCRNPNLQQVSGAEDVRDLFRGDLFLGDYGGLEVRISAHFSQDPVMLDVFRGGHDLYGTLAANAWGGEADKSNPGRGLMKVLMLASQYGARGPKIAEILAIAGMHGYTPSKASKLLRDLENTLPRLFAWREEVIQDATGHGFVTTIGGRQRHLPGIKGRDWSAKAKAERQAVNSLVQGSAADIVRRAMLAARVSIRPEVAKMVLQVHDEILWKRGPDWDDEYAESIVAICERQTGFALDVPLIFEAKIADSWAAKGGTGGQVSTGAYAMLNESMTKEAV